MDLSDPEQFSRVYDDHHSSVFAAALRAVDDPTLAGDVVQDVFLRLWRRPESFDARRADVGTYLRLMARSRAVDLWRESQSRGRATDRFGLVAAAEGRCPDEAVALDERRAAVRQALSGLPRPQREAIVLAYWGGMTAEEIARRERIPLGTAKSRIRLGLAKLRTDMAPAAPAAA